MVSLILLSRSISSRSAEVVDEESVVFSPSNLTFVLRFLNLFDFPFIFLRVKCDTEMLLL